MFKTTKNLKVHKFKMKNVKSDTSKNNIILHTTHTHT